MEIIIRLYCFWCVNNNVLCISSKNELGDFKALPDRLDIRFFSYAENKMYQGSFDLPYEKILALFKAGVAKDKETPTFQKLIAGIAPG